jgi:acetyl-CoA carboxylase beta subunit
MHNYILGILTVVIAYAFYDAGREEEVDTEEESNLVVNDFSRKLYQMSCQTCRKIKNHREVEAKVYECTRCKRRTDLTAS